MTPGYDTALVRMDPTGEVIVTTGTCGHGQGHETTFAQIVADRLGVHPDQVRLRQGDTDLAAYGWGTFASRSIVIGGGAAARAADLVAGQLREVAAHLLEAGPADVELSEGAARIRGDAGQPSRSASLPASSTSRPTPCRSRCATGSRRGRPSTRRARSPTPATPPWSRSTRVPAASGSAATWWWRTAGSSSTR